MREVEVTKEAGVRGTRRWRKGHEPKNVSSL
jgi:hypothetical protein